MSTEEKEPLKQEDSKNVEKEKSKALLAGVIFFMVLIVILWVMNLGMMFKKVPAKNNDQLNIDQLSQGFQQSFNEAGAKMSQLKKIDAAELEKYSNQMQAVYSTDTAVIKK